MIELTGEFKKNIINRYGEIGEEWLNSINNIIEKYKRKFNLSNIKLIKNLTMNVLIYANSNKYGEVVLKIGSPGKNTISEINYISLYSSKYFARCYYYNIEDRVMLLERISPGYDLMNLKNQKERISIFCNILNNIIVKDTSNNKFRLYDDIVKENIKFVNDNKYKFTNILHMLDVANNLYNEIKQLNLPKYVLHNDLHHGNILKSDQGWKVIDPHGIIGEKIFDTIQFIRNELEHTSLEKMNEVISLISNYLNEDKMLIYKALYISVFCKIVNYIKAKYDINKIFYNIEVCEKIFKYLEENQYIKEANNYIHIYDNREKLSNKLM